MNTYFAKRLLDLTNELSKVENNKTTVIEKCEAALAVLASYDREFKEKLRTDDFQTPEEEIYYFRHQRPVFTSEVIYNVKLYHIELRKPAGSFRYLRDFYRKELFRIDQFFERNEGFIRYLRSGCTELDDFFFRRNNITYKTVPDTSYFILDHTLTTDFDWKLGKLKALEKLAEYLFGCMNDVIGILDKIEREKQDSVPEAKIPAPAPLGFSDLLKTYQVLKRLKISRSKLQRLKDAGKLPFIKSEGTIYYRESDVLEYLDRNRHNEFDR